MDWKALVLGAIRAAALVYAGWLLARDKPQRGGVKK